MQLKDTITNRREASPERFRGAVIQDGLVDPCHYRALAHKFVVLYMIAFGRGGFAKVASSLLPKE